MFAALHISVRKAMPLELFQIKWGQANLAVEWTGVSSLNSVTDNIDKFDTHFSP